MKYLNRETNIVMVQAKRGLHKLVQSSMVFVKRIAGEEAFFRTLHLGGKVVFARFATKSTIVCTHPDTSHVS